jgi:S1-C subfamily serine protease
MFLSKSGRTAGKFSLLAFWAVLFASTVSAEENSLGQLEAGLNDLIYQLSRSVVTVESHYSAPTGPGIAPQEESIFTVIGTGIIYDSAGHILTTTSSVANASDIVIRFEGRNIPARLKAVDHQSGLVMLKADKPVGVPARVSQYHGCAGNMVLTLGNAYGLRAAPSIGFCAGVRPDGIIQFTAPITSGAIGGGVYDLSGELLGIIAGGIGDGEISQVGLAIPANEVRDVAPHLISRGDRAAGYVGLTTTEIEIVPPLELQTTGYMQTSNGRNLVIDRGAVVTNVVPNSPAARAGLKVNDLLFSVNRGDLPSATQLANMVRQSQPGALIELGILRRSRTYFIPVKVGKAEMSAVELRFNFVVGEHQYDNFRDSLLLEINTLKQTIIDLESNLQRLK